MPYPEAEETVMNPEHFEAPFITEEMQSISVVCTECGSHSKPDFWTKHNDPFERIASTHPNGGFWRQVGVGVRCSCGATNHVPVKAIDLQHPLYMFGDEAFRGDEGSRHFVGVYSLLGATSGPIKEIEDGLLTLKSEVLSDRDPRSWSIHATKMASGQQRLKHRAYRNLRREDVDLLFSRCAELISQLGEWGWNRCIMTVYQIGNHPKKERSAVRRSLNRGLYLGLIGDAIYRATAQRLHPLFTFDAQSPSAPATGSEGWADAAYFGSRHYLGHLFITHGNDVRPPRFVAPASEPLLELADVHAFHAARSIWQRAQGITPERGLQQFGSFSYINYRADRVLTQVGSDIPDSFIF